MARCPFATWKEITGPSGGFMDGPFRIVHHTTEGSSADSAFAAFLANKSDPHFTVDATSIFQHIDTDQFARSLRHIPPGGRQTESPPSRSKSLDLLTCQKGQMRYATWRGYVAGSRPHTPYLASGRADIQRWQSTARTREAKIETRQRGRHRVVTMDTVTSRRIPTGILDIRWTR